MAELLRRDVEELWPEILRRRDLPWTEDHARALLSSGPLGGEEVEGHVTARLKRQARSSTAPGHR